MTLSALTRLTSEMQSPQKQNQNREGAMASAGGFMVPCFSLPHPQPRPPNQSSLERSQEPLSCLHTGLHISNPRKMTLGTEPQTRIWDRAAAKANAGAKTIQGQEAVRDSRLGHDLSHQKKQMGEEGGGPRPAHWFQCLRGQKR